MQVKTTVFSNSSAHRKIRQPNDRYFDEQHVPESLVPKKHAEFWEFVGREMQSAQWFKLT